MSMKRLWIPVLVFAGLALNGTAGAQTSSGSQSSAASGTQASASSDKANLQAQSSSNANAAQTANAPAPKKSAKASGSASNSTSVNASAGPAAANLSSGTEINAELLTSLDASRSKAGDRVVARATKDVKQDGQVVLRKHTKLIGHVTQAQARAKGAAESSLGIAFDNAVTKDGQEMPFHAAIQAVAAAQAASSAALENDEIGGSASGVGSGTVAGGGRSGGGLLGGGGAAASGVAGAAGNAAGNVGRTTNAGLGAASNTAASASGNAGGLNAAGQLTSSSRGVFGLEGLNLSSALSNKTQGSLLVSSTRNVHLSSGTQILLRTVKQ